MREAKLYDLIIFGATGYTGSLVADHIARRAAGRRWALAGRNAFALERIRKRVAGGNQPDLLFADATDLPSLRNLAREGKVIITTAGPYASLGSALVRACAEGGTDYVDISGEWPWMRTMIENYERTARSTGARMLFSCGFDSLPFELGVHRLQKLAKERFGHPLPNVIARIKMTGGGFSSGTVASFRKMVRGVDGGLDSWWDADPFSLTPGFSGASHPRCARDIEQHCNSWVVPSIFLPINRANLHRSNHLTEFSFGKRFTYSEFIDCGKGEEGRVAARNWLDLYTVLAGATPWPNPDDETRATGRYKISMSGSSESLRNHLSVEVTTVHDAGYGSTSRMVGETALCLLTQGQSLPGGIWTPTALLGDSLCNAVDAYADLYVQEAQSAEVFKLDHR
jgi:short subunit dehydrogenase-like uncharacterized protein